MSRKCLVVISLSAVFMHFPSQAEIIDIDLKTGKSRFSDFQYSRYPGYAGPSFSTYGFTFRNSHNSDDSLTNFVDLAKDRNWDQGILDFNANGYNPTLGVSYDDSLLTIEKIDKTAFSFNGLQIADTWNQGRGGLVDITFQDKYGARFTKSIELEKKKGLQKFSFDPNNVTAVYLRGNTTPNHGFQMDFIDVGEAFISSVPEPSTWAFMLIGFGVIGYATRRTRVRSMRMQAV